LRRDGIKKIGEPATFQDVAGPPILSYMLLQLMAQELLRATL